MLAAAALRLLDTEEEEEEGQVRFMTGATMAELPTSTVNTPPLPNFTIERSEKGRVTRNGEEGGVRRLLLLPPPPPPPPPPFPPTLKDTTLESIERLGMRS